MTAILLTATIVPNVLDSLIINNPNERQEQYLNSIRWYIKNTNFEIVFCENSGTNICPFLSPDEKKRVEVLTFYQTPIADKSKDRGYTELMIIEYALHNSSTLRRADCIVKGTGRLILKNIKSIVKQCEGREGSKKFICAWLVYGYLYADSRFFVCSLDWLSYFVTYKEKISTRFNFETALAHAISRSHYEGFSFYYPFERPWVRGIGGGCGIQYELPQWKWLLSSLRMFPLAILYNCGYMPK